jgi:hypothetical protein
VLGVTGIPRERLDDAPIRIAGLEVHARLHPGRNRGEDGFDAIGLLEEQRISTARAIR